MKKTSSVIACLATALLMTINPVNAATLTALSTFGGGDGWVSPGATPKLGTASLERGMAYNPATNNVLFVSRDQGVFVEVLNGVTGAKVGNLNTTGIAGGTFALSTIGVDAEGVIYAANLNTSPTDPFKIYRWTDESAAPTVAFSGNPTGARYGDTFDVIGSGANTRLLAGHGQNAAPNNTFNNFTVFTTGDGLSYSASPITIATNPPAVSSFRLGITFTDNDTVVGRGDANNTRIVDVDASLTTGTLVASNTFAVGTTLRQMDYTVLGNGLPILAVLQNGGTLAAGQNSRVFVYDMTDPNNPLEIAQGNTTLLSPANANANGVGSVKFGMTGYRKAVIYAMDTNNGIQAFELTTVPEPTGLVLFGICCLLGSGRVLRRV